MPYGRSWVVGGADKDSKSIRFAIQTHKIAQWVVRTFLGTVTGPYSYPTVGGSFVGHQVPVGLEKLDIVVHPQSVIHSMVEYRDRSTLAQLGPSDMRVPIACCLSWPKRMDTPLEPLNLAQIGELTFFEPDAMGRS